MNIDQLLEKLDFSHCYTTDKRHCKMLYQQVVKEGAKNIIEIGSYKGISTACLALAAKETKGLVDAVDPSTECSVKDREKLWVKLELARYVQSQVFTCGDYFAILRKSILSGDCEHPDFIFHDGIHGPHAMPEYKLAWELLADGGTFAAHDLDQVDRKELEAILQPCGMAIYDTDAKGRTIGFLVKG